MKTIKLSDKQKEVIRLMREGASLMWSQGTRNSFWFLQKPSGETVTHNPITFRKLRTKKIIYSPQGLELNKTFELTELGKTIQI